MSARFLYRVTCLSIVLGFCLLLSATRASADPQDIVPLSFTSPTVCVSPSPVSGDCFEDGVVTVSFQFDPDTKS